MPKTGNIFVIFTPGCYGSTIEYLLRFYTSFPIKIDNAKMLNDGSMHSFNKMFHDASFELVEKIQKENISPIIFTPITVTETKHAWEITDFFKSVVTDNDTICWLSTETIEEMEICLLIIYEKIIKGFHNGNLLKYFPLDNVDNLQKWNINATHYTDLEIWQQRELISLLLPTWMEEWVNECKVYKKLQNHLFYSLNEIYDDIAKVIENICNDYGLEILDKTGFEKFIFDWKLKQTIFFENYKLLTNIVKNIDNSVNITWDKQNIIWEAILQSHLTKNNYELKCYGLNEFPCNLNDLRKLLVQINS